MESSEKFEQKILEKLNSKYEFVDLFQNPEKLIDVKNKQIYISDIFDIEIIVNENQVFILDFFNTGDYNIYNGKLLNICYNTFEIFKEVKLVSEKEFNNYTELKKKESEEIKKIKDYEVLKELMLKYPKKALEIFNKN